MMRLSLQIPVPSTANLGVEKWISSLEDSPVNPPPLQDEDQDKTTSDGFSLILGESCEKRTHKACSWRMCEDSYLLMMATVSKKSSGTWPVSGTMSSGVFSKRQMLEPVIGENGYLSTPKWPTPDTTDRNYKPQNFRKDTNFNPETGLGRHSVSLGQVASSWKPEYSKDMNWPTPDTMPEAPNQNSNVKNRPKSLLKTAQLAMEFNPPSSPKKPELWGTPTARDYKDTGDNTDYEKIAKKKKLSGQAVVWPTPTTQETPHYNMELTESGRRKTKDGKDSHSLNLQDTTANWSTPMASDDGAKATVNSHQKGLISDADRFHGHPVQQALNGDKSSAKDPTLPRLNPKFVEWMMGWPEDWLELTSYAYLETE
jgi:hypothetical protein